MIRVLFIFIWIIAFQSAAATIYTEFYVQTTGSNLNAGSTTDDTSPQTYAAGTFVRATGVFTVASGDPSADGVTSNQWASVYTSDWLIPGCVGRITNVSTTTITIDISTVSGATANVSESAAASTCKVGGAWKGPGQYATGSGYINTNQFPFGFIATNSVTTNVALANAQLWPRCNIKSNAIYSVTNAMTHNLAGPTRFEGYLTTPGDGGRANIDGGAAGASYTVLTTGTSSSDCALANLILSNNGNSGTADYLMRIQGIRSSVYRVTVHDAWRQGLNMSSAGGFLVECEAYGNNRNNNSSSSGGFHCQSATTFVRCISHNNTTSNGDGFVFDNGVAGTLINCIAARNGRNGVRATGAPIFLIACDIWSNAGNGVDSSLSTIGDFYAENCNFLLNGGSGFTSSGSTLRHGYFINCGFGSGTQTNASGGIAANNAAVQIIGSLTYAADVYPWTDPTNGNFKIILGAAKSAGIGAYIESGGAFSSGATVAFPDIGAAQSPSTNAASASGGSWTFAQ